MLLDLFLVCYFLYFISYFYQRSNNPKIKELCRLANRSLSYILIFLFGGLIFNEILTFQLLILIVLGGVMTYDEIRQYHNLFK